MIGAKVSIICRLQFSQKCVVINAHRHMFLRVQHFAQGHRMDKVIKRFYGDLVSKLPMDDAKFRALLFSADLFPGDLKQAIQAQPTSADKAEYFIDHGINNEAENFVKLVDVMTNSGNNSLVKLAAEIRRDSYYSGITGLSLILQCIH